MKRQGTSLSQAFPDIASSWDFARNGDLIPADVTAFTNKKVWWKCDKCGESWLARVAARTAGTKTGCSYCAGKQVSPSRSFGALYPDIAQQWDVKKNVALKPDQLLPKSNRKVWWICTQGHSYHSTIASRVSGRGCPICSGNLVIESTSFAAKFPELVEQWHSDKNLPLTPVEVSPYSGKKVWWKCPSGHEWQAQILNRSYANSGCPYCAGQKVCTEKSLLVVNPELAAEWHPSRITIRNQNNSCLTLALNLGGVAHEVMNGQRQ